MSLPPANESPFPSPKRSRVSVSVSNWDANDPSDREELSSLVEKMACKLGSQGEGDIHISISLVPDILYTTDSLHDGTQKMMEEARYTLEIPNIQIHNLVGLQRNIQGVSAEYKRTRAQRFLVLSALTLCVIAIVALLVIIGITATHGEVVTSIAVFVPAAASVLVTLMGAYFSETLHESPKSMKKIIRRLLGKAKESNGSAD